MSEKLGLQGVVDRIKDEEGVFRLLEDLQETIFHYKVRPGPGTLPQN